MGFAHISSFEYFLFCVIWLFDPGEAIFLYIAAGFNHTELAAEINLMCEQNRLGFVVYDFL